MGAADDKGGQKVAQGGRGSARRGSTSGRARACPIDCQVDDYLQHLVVERDSSRNTLEAYSRDLRSFVEALAEAGVDDAREVERPHVLAWVHALARRGLSPSSQARMQVSVRGLFRYLRRSGALTSDPCARVAVPRSPRRLPRTVPRDDVRRLLAATGARPRDRALVAVMYGCGLRVTESVRLELEAVGFDAGFVKVLGKGRKERIVPMGSLVADCLHAYVRGERAAVLGERTSRWLFLGRNAEKPLTRQAAFVMLRRLALAAGLSALPSPHKLRHAFATDLVRGGADLRSVQAMLGHADLRTTEIYTHVDREELRRAYDLAHPRR